MHSLTIKNEFLVYYKHIHWWYTYLTELPKNLIRVTCEDVDFGPLDCDVM